MSLTGSNAKPGYMSYLPASYQVLRPEQDSALTQILVTSEAEQQENGTIVEFFVKTPNVRCRTRVALVLEPDVTSEVDVRNDLNTVILDGTGTLWVAELERTASGGAKRRSPVRNVVATGAAPLAVPTDARLWGYAFEVETNGQELYGQFNPAAIALDPAAASKWLVAVTYESVERLTDEEWNQFLGQYGVYVNPTGGIVQGA